MSSAPASIPATTLVAFTAALGEPTGILSRNSPGGPALSARVITAGSPPQDTRFGSSNPGWIP